MNWPIIIIIGSQLIFSTSDLLARHYMHKLGFSLSTFLSVWFLFYIILKILATTGQLYVFSTVELGKIMALFGAISIVLANLLGFLILKEILSPTAYIGVTLSILAFLILAFK